MLAVLLLRVVLPFPAVGQRQDRHQVARLDGEEGDAGDDEDDDEQPAQNRDGGVVPIPYGVALQVAFERQTLKPAFSLDRL